MTFCKRPLADAREVIVVQLQLLDLMIRKEAVRCRWTRRHAPISSISWPALWWRSFAGGGSNDRSRYSPKINRSTRLARRLLLRQSSDKRVRQNTESQLLQYAVAERVHAMGWTQVEVINRDLGSSAPGYCLRPGGRLRACPQLVALGEVGMVGSREVSRLSRDRRRTGAGFWRCVRHFWNANRGRADGSRFELSRRSIGAGHQRHAQRCELKVIRQRLLAGQESKARRGELFKRLPIGYARDAVGNTDPQ